MKLIKSSVILAGLISVASALSACSTYDDGYRRGYSSVSVGVWTGPGYYGSYRDRDGDGVPNRYDRHPNNPYRP